MFPIETLHLYCSSTEMVLAAGMWYSGCIAINIFMDLGIQILCNFHVPQNIIWFVFQPFKNVKTSLSRTVLTGCFLLLMQSQYWIFLSHHLGIPLSFLLDHLHFLYLRIPNFMVYSLILVVLVAYELPVGVKTV